MTYFQMQELMKKAEHRDKMLKFKGNTMSSGIQQIQTANEIINNSKNKKKKYQIILVNNNLLIQLDNWDKDLISIPINNFFNLCRNDENKLQLDVRDSKITYDLDGDSIIIKKIIEEVFEILKNIKNKGMI